MKAPAENVSHVTVEEAAQLATVLLSAPNAAALLQALRRRWLLATSVGLVCSLAAAITAWLLVPTRFTARALLDVAANPPKVMFNTNENRIDPYHTFQKKQQ